MQVLREKNLKLKQGKAYVQLYLRMGHTVVFTWMHTYIFISAKISDYKAMKPLFGTQVPTSPAHIHSYMCLPYIEIQM